MPSNTPLKAPDLPVRERCRELVNGLGDLYSRLVGDPGEHPAYVADVCRVATALTAALGELRQAEKAEQRALAAIPLGDLVAYLRALPEAKRREIADLLSGAHDEEPLL